MNLSDFNSLTPNEATAVLRPCLDIPRWITTVVNARPFSTVQLLRNFAESAAPDWTVDEIDHALAHHPRIGEQAAGLSPEAGLSRQEQAGLSSSATTTALLRSGNIAYEQKFGRVFLIRAKGRTAEEILGSLQQRLDNTVNQEIPVIARELRDIALLRLEGLFTP